MSDGLLRANLVLAWSWMVLGFFSGAFLGLGFHREDWLGGYGSWKRRLLRLGHISFFGLGLTNLAFWATARLLPATPAVFDTASTAFLLGAATMPACCAWAAHQPRARHLFFIPVGSLLVAGTTTLLGLL